MSYAIWIVVGVAFLIGEIFTLDFSLSCIGLACLSAGLVSWLGLNVYWQLVTVSVILVLLFFTLRPFVLKHLSRKNEYKSNVEALVGTQHNFYALKEDKKHALIKIDGDVWEAVSATPLIDGKTIKIVKVEGTTLIVKQEEK